MANDEKEVGKRQDRVREEFQKKGMSEELKRRDREYVAALKKRDAERRSK